ncbi:MAG: hypothetical protein NZ732_00505, partial [Candidatus Poseidoniales archaeon]|nr:hypothetical protein [Candidatus Poseidoniales archaeon]
GNLSLVGSGGRFVAVLTKRQLTLERFDGHGIRLSLASISRMRHMKVPLFPSGTVPLGLLAIYLGTSVLMPPYAMVAMAGGSLTLLGYVLSRTSVLAVETEAGDRHIISGSEGVLLRLCLMVDRVRHGSTIEEARMGLEHIDAELPAYPAFTDAGGGLPEPKGLLELPEEESFLATVPEPESHFTGFSAPTPPSTTAPAAASTEPIFPWESEVVAADTVPTYEPPPVPQEEARSAYERAWGREEAPQWYEENPAGSRIDSALGEAAVGMDLFGEGGIFDAETPASYSPPTTSSPTASHPAPETGVGSYINAAGPPVVEARQPTSSQMIRRAQGRFGETGPYTGPSLPAPTDSAIREECRPGVVKQARARQALLGSGESSQPVLDASSLEEFPGLSRIATSMSSGRVRAPRRKAFRKPSWISALLGATTPTIRNTDGTYASEYSDEDGQEARSGTRFQSSQHIRLRSDQDHQADVAVRARQGPADPPASAKDAMDRLVGRVSGEEERVPTELTGQDGGLRFSQLRRTSSKGDPHPLPGIRRLE